MPDTLTTSNLAAMVYAKLSCRSTVRPRDLLQVEVYLDASFSLAKTSQESITSVLFSS